MRAENGRVRIGILLFLLAAIVAMYYAADFLANRKGPAGKPSGKSSSGSVRGNPADLPLEEKPKVAESYLKDFKSELEGFFTNLDRARPSQQELQKHMEQYNNIVQGYIGKINQLKLACPSAVKAKGGTRYQRYISWSDDFRKRDQEVMNWANQKIQKLLKGAGFSPR